MSPISGPYVSYSRVIVYPILGLLCALYQVLMCPISGPYVSYSRVIVCPILGLL